jgi:hypothetical protein
LLHLILEGCWTRFQIDFKSKLQLTGHCLRGIVNLSTPFSYRCP